jgi:hypothetical protein
VTTTTPTRAARPWLFAAGGAAASMALTAYGSFKEANEPGDVPGWLFINVPIILAVTALVFGLAVVRALGSDDPETPARTALVLSLIGLATVAVAYYGTPAVLAAAAVCTATDTRRRTGRWTGPGAVAVVVSAVDVALALTFALLG